MKREPVLRGIENFRDFGGYPGAEGRRLKHGVLFRSAAHGRATPEDLEAVAALGIAVVVDLRRPGERERDPSPRHPRFAGEVIVSDLAEAEGEDGWLALLQESDLSEATFRAYLMDYYRAAPFAPRHIDLFARYFRALAAAPGAVLIHCAAGKDRTGILVALTHHVAGVAQADTLADYLATNDPVRLAARREVVSEAIGAVAGRTPTPAAVQIAMGVEAAYLDAALRAIAEKHGDTDTYLEAALGVDGYLRAAIRDPSPRIALPTPTVGSAAAH